MTVTSGHGSARRRLVRSSIEPDGNDQPSSSSATSFFGAVRRNDASRSSATSSQSVCPSASTRSTSLALWGSLGFFALFQFLWGFVTNLIVYVVNGFSTPANFSFFFGYLTGGPDWYQFLGLLSPSSAYESALNAVLPSAASGGSMPFYIQPWFGIVVLAIWIAVPLVFGYLRFESTDL